MTRQSRHYVTSTKAILSYLLLLMCSGHNFGQDSGIQLINELRGIKELPQEVILKNTIKVNNEGGHLQGIQLIKRGSKELVFLSGSSSTHAYAAVAKLGKKGTVKKVHHLYNKPLKHAGGFQVCENYLAVGIEDNESRTNAEVIVYDISKPFKAPIEVQKIVRKGAFERVTAGCVAMARYKEHWILIVGNWNTRDLDFYLSNTDGARMEEFDLVQSLKMDAQDRSHWSDPEWLAYQNINLIARDNALYLMGMSSNADSDNVADLFQVSTPDMKQFAVRKISRKILQNTGGDFVWGSGVIIQNNQLIGLLSCDRNLSSKSILYFYR